MADTSLTLTGDSEQAHGHTRVSTGTTQGVVVAEGTRVGHGQRLRKHVEGSANIATSGEFLANTSS